MMKYRKTIATMAAAIMMTGLVSGAVADEKIYTSPIYKIPKNLIVGEDGELPEDLPSEDLPSDEDYDSEYLLVNHDDEEIPEGYDENGFYIMDPEQQEQQEQTEVQDEPQAVENQPEEAPQNVPKRVTVFSSRGEETYEGQAIELQSVLEGFDGLEVTYQWQVDRGNGAGWEDVPRATHATYRFIANEETILYDWRVIVSIVD